MNAEYCENYHFGSSTLFEPLASCMSSPSAQGPDQHAVCFGESPPRIYPSRLTQMRSANAGVPLAFLVGPLRGVGSYQNVHGNNGLVRIMSTSINPGLQDNPGEPPHALQATYVSAPQGLASTRRDFAHFSTNAQRTSDSGSAASGSDTPLAFQGLSASTLVPPGDEHTDALLQSLMSMPSKPMAQSQLAHQQTSGGPSCSSGVTSGPSDFRLPGLGSATPAPLELLLAQTQGTMSLRAASKDVRSQVPASFRDDDNALMPRSIPLFGPSIVATAANMPYGSAMQLNRHNAAIATDITQPVSNASPSIRLQLEQFEHQGLMLLPQAALSRLTMQSDFSLGTLQSDTSLTPSPTAAEAEAMFRRQEAARGFRQRASPADVQPVVASRSQPAVSVVTHLQQQQAYGRLQLVHKASTAVVASIAAPLPPPHEQQQDRQSPSAPHKQRLPFVGDLPMGDAQAFEPTVGAPSLVALGQHRSGLAAVDAAAAEENGDAGKSASARQKRRFDTGKECVTEMEPVHMAQVTTEACNDNICTEVGSGGGGGGGGRSAPTGSFGRLSSGDFNVQAAPDKAEPGPADVRSGSDGGEVQGDKECGDLDDDYTTDNGSGGFYNRSSKKRTASQRRRGSSAIKKELSRERNRTAQRRFRERQRDLIRVLQEQVERQDVLIQELRSRLAVYEDKPLYADEGAVRCEPGSTSETGC